MTIKWQLAYGGLRERTAHESRSCLLPLTHRPWQAAPAETRCLPGVWGGLGPRAAAPSPKNLLVKVTLGLKIVEGWSWWAWPAGGVGRKHGDCGRGSVACWGQRQSSVLSFSTSQVDQVFSPSGDLRASGHHFPLLSSSSMTVGSGLWRAEL